MKLQDLQTRGAFVTGAPVMTPIKWGGNTFQVQVQRLTFAQVMETADLGDGARNVALIAKSIVLDGGVQLTEEQAGQLQPELATQFLLAVAKVNRLDGAEADPKA